MSLLRITSFRAALAYTLIVVALVGLVLGFIMQNFAAQLTALQERQIWREAAGLSQIYDRDGARALAAAVDAGANAAQGRVLRLSTGLGRFWPVICKTYPRRLPQVRRMAGRDLPLMGVRCARVFCGWMRMCCC